MYLFISGKGRKINISMEHIHIYRISNECIHISQIDIQGMYPYLSDRYARNASIFLRQISKECIHISQIDIQGMYPYLSDRYPRNVFIFLRQISKECIHISQIDRKLKMKEKNFNVLPSPIPSAAKTNSSTLLIPLPAPLQ